MARSSARRSSAPPIRRPRPARSSRPARRRSTRPTSRAGRSSRSAASPTRRASWPRSRRRRRDRPQRGRRARPASSTLDEAADARAARPQRRGSGDRRPRDRRDHRRRDAEHRIAAIVAALDPDVVQLSGDESPRVGRARVGRRTWKVLHLPADGAGRSRRGRGATSCRAAAPTWRPGSTGSCSTRPAGRIRAAPARGPSERLAAAVAREVPVMLAGGLTPANVAGGAARRSRPSASMSPPGVERPRVAGRAPDQGPAPRRAVRQARAGRPRRPAEHRLRADPGPPRPARRRRRRALGDGARLRRPLRARDADGRARAARDGVRRAPPGPGRSGPSCASCSGRSPAARPRSTARTAWRAAVRDRGGRGSPARGADGRRAIPAPAALPQARGPRPHRRPQDQQRARPGAAHPPARQDPGHRRDRRRPARRGDRDRLRAARPAVRRLHGRRGHRAPGPERAPDARPRRGGPLRDVGDGHAQGRGQRGDARLGDQRRDDPLRARLGDGAAPVPDDRARPPAPDRRRGGGPARRGRGPAARTSRSPASVAARTRSGCWPGSSASRRSGWRSSRRPATASRPGGTRRRSSAARRASSTARAR